MRMARFVLPFVWRLVCLVLLSFSGVTLHAGGPVVSEEVYATISEAQRLLQRAAHQRALDALAPALEGGHINEYERALLQRLAGVAAVGAGDYPAATAHFERALRSRFLPDQVGEQLRYRLARLYVLGGRNGDALALWKRWTDMAACPAARSCFLIASIHAAGERWPLALAWAERGLAQSDAPSEREYAFVADLNLAVKNFVRAAELLNLLVGKNPDNARYWRQLSAAYAELGRGHRAAAIAELGYLQDALSSAADIDHLASLHLHTGAPGKAVRVLEDALRKRPQIADARLFHLLGKAWFSAREYTHAVTALEKAAEHLYDADPRRAADVYLLKGMAYARLFRHEEAKLAFAYCLRFDGTREVAGRWLDYLARQASS